ncbi:Mau-2p [Parelaphostrongylus tenuis]|uniref:Cohesin loading complex subunit SCC4 homolog n=1 Tax=Parelaphostrongylus tenuis TaxID=148309 RepID=A0AAD5RB98_PARTN|nr:Mau-2p [Parelaphostrongylus tenuis]
MASGDHVAMTMLAMAETLRQLQPPKVKMAIKCAKGALTLSLSAEMTAHVRFQLGKLYFFYTENLDLALQCLESAYEIMTRLGDYFTQPRLEALTLICEALIHGPPSTANNNRVLALIRAELNSAKLFPLIYAKMLLYYIEVNTIEGRADDALEACQIAIQHCDDPVVNLYFRLTKNMVSARVSGTVCDDSETLIIGQLINRLDQSSPSTANLKLFYICTLLAFMLSDGKTRSSRQHLRTLQSEVQTLSKDGASVQLGIRWMDTVPLTVFACLMTIVNSALQCNYERAAKYYTIAVRHIHDYNARASRNPCEYGILRSVQRMRMALNEMMAQCNIMACHPSMAMDNIRDMVQYSQRYGMALFDEFGPAIQSLLGHYCSYLREPEAAEKHFFAATKFKSCKDKNIWVMTHVNLAITYLAQCKHAEFYEIADQLTANRIANCFTDC